MKLFRAIEHSSMTTYDFFFEEGKLTRLHCYDSNTKEDIFDESNNPIKNQAIEIKKFEKAVKVLCQDSTFDRVEEFIGTMLEETYKNLTKKIIASQIFTMSDRVTTLSRVLWFWEM